MDNSHDVSVPITTFAPHTHDRFSLVRRDRLYEFGYKTDVYLANNSEFIYTRITTISPLYVVANLTNSTILFAQQCAKKSPLFVRPEQRVPFNWDDKDGEKLVCVRAIPGKHEPDANCDFDWSVGIPLDHHEECGNLIIQNRQIID